MSTCDISEIIYTRCLAESLVRSNRLKVLTHSSLSSWVFLLTHIWPTPSPRGGGRGEGESVALLGRRGSGLYSH